MLKAAELCPCEDDKPTLPDSPPSLASAHEHPDKDLKALFPVINIDLLLCTVAFVAYGFYNEIYDITMV